jgi:hypothetical protein
MSNFLRRSQALAAAILVVLAALTLAPGGAESQTASDFKQVRLTDKHVRGFIDSQGDISRLAPKLQAAGDKPDPALIAELEGIAKKHGFASFADLDDIAANISMVMAGIDPQSGAYTDPVDAIKKEMEEIKADKAIPEKDKKAMLDEMAEALKTTPPLQYKENVDLVRKYQKEIEKVLQ